MVSTNVMRIRAYKYKLVYSIFFVFMLNSNDVVASNDCVLLFYPHVAEPYRTALNEIISGVEHGSKYKIHALLIEKNMPDIMVKQFADQFPCKMILGLGRWGLKKALQFPQHRIAAAVLAMPDENIDAVVLSLVPDPEVVFNKVKQLVPLLMAVHVVYNPEETGALIERAKQIAKQQNLVINAYPANTQKDSIEIYQELFKKLNPSRDAVWLPNDNSVFSPEILLPLVLKQSWRYSIAVFSSHPSYVRNGVLLSVYPDNTKIGHRIAGVLNDCLSVGCKQGQVLLMRNMLVAYNRRTGDRLRLNIDWSSSTLINSVFPVQ